MHDPDAPRPLTLRAVLAYSSLLFGVLSVANAFELLVTRGVCWMYVFGFFITLVVVHGVLRPGRFGMGIAMFVLYATVGTFMEYWMEYVVTPALIAPWAVVVWGLAGPGAGLSADLAHRFLPRALSAGTRAAATGVAFVSALFLLVLIALSVSYVDPAPGLAHYLNGIGFTLPWLVASGGFAGYVAHALRRTADDAAREVPRACGRPLRIRDDSGLGKDLPVRPARPRDGSPMAILPRSVRVLAVVSAILAASLLVTAPRARAGTAVVFEETFEDGSIVPSWAINDTNPAAGQDYWEVSTYRAHTGTYSAWSAQVGTQSIGGQNNTDVHEYDDEMQADLIVDLRVDGYTSLNLSFYYWARTESGGGDWIQAWYEANGTQYVIFDPRGSTGNNWDFATVSVPNDVERLIIRFHSDSANHGFEGAYVDDILLTGAEFMSPSSAVASMPTYSNGMPYRVPYAASDNPNASGIDYVELWYRQGTSGNFTLYTSPLNTSGRWTTATVPFDVTYAQGDGYYEFYTIAVDRAGNREAAPGPADGSVTIDTTAPSLAITAPVADASLPVGDVLVEWQASDALSGIDHFEVSVDGGTFGAAGMDLSRSLAGLAEGIHEVTVRAVDRAGNAREASVTFLVGSAAAPFPWWILILLAAVILAGVLFYMFWTRKKEKDETKMVLESVEKKGPPPSV